MTVEEILAALQAIIDGAGTEPLTEEQVEQYEALEVKLQAAQKSAELRKRNAAYNVVRTPAGVPTARRTEPESIDKAFSSYLRTGRGNADLAGLRSNDPQMAQAVGTDAAGGYLVPDIMRDKIIERLKAFGGIAGAAEEITTSGGEILRWPTLDDTGNAGVIAAEGTAPASGGADLVFGEKILGAFKYVAPGAGNLPLRVSVELLQDSAFDIEALVQRKLGERIGRKQAVDFVGGAGTTLPFGITTGTAATAVTAGGLTYGKLVTLVHTVDPAYRMDAKWAFNDATLALIEGIVDTTGRPILNDANAGIATGPQNKTLLGYPVIIDQAFPNYLDASAAKWGVFGDIKSGYVIRRVKDLTLIVNPYARANEGQVEYVLWARADAVVQDPNAYRVLINT
jgi:HK97 family phage major capsid protein